MALCGIRMSVCSSEVVQVQDIFLPMILIGVVVTFVRENLTFCVRPEGIVPRETSCGSIRTTSPKEIALCR